MYLLLKSGKGNVDRMTSSSPTVFIVLNLIAAAAAECPDGWVVYQGSCYQFGHQASPFTEAEHYCEQHGAYLVHLNDQSEYTFLLSFLRDLKQTKHWIGMTDRDIEGVWTWVDNNEKVRFTDWYPGEPNQALSANCVAIREDFGYKWVDDPCSLIYYPICEKRIVDGVETVG